MKQTADGRLLAAAAFVRPGAVLGDIGTDHAYLPIYLLGQGRIKSAVAADIGAGPLARAQSHIAAAGYRDRIETVLTDGLCGLEDKGLSDIAICGMGGELIVSILSRAPFVRDSGVRLILQPMTRAAFLRRYLAENGFAVLAEKPCRAGGRVYSCLCAAYNGKPYGLSPAEAEVGRPSLDNEEERACFAELLSRKMNAIQARMTARGEGNWQNEEDGVLLQSLCALAQDYGIK